jgi:HSP20 family protein
VDFQLGSWRSPFGRSVFDVQPFWRGEIGWGRAPAVDVVEKETA